MNFWCWFQPTNSPHINVLSSQALSYYGLTISPSLTRHISSYFDVGFTGYDVAGCSRRQVSQIFNHAKDSDGKLRSSVTDFTFCVDASSEQFGFPAGRIGRSVCGLMILQTCICSLFYGSWTIKCWALQWRVSQAAVWQLSGFVCLWNVSETEKLAQVTFLPQKHPQQ